MSADVEYVCETCGELIVVPIDLSAGHRQQYVEDCPVCCHPNTISVVVDDVGGAHAECEAE